MTTATWSQPAVRQKPPFRADHVGSFLRPKKLLDARDRHKARHAFRERAARGRGRSDPRNRALPGGPRPARHHRRRVPAHLFPHRLSHQALGRHDQGRHQRELPQRGRQRGLAPPVMQVTGKVRHDVPIQRADFEFLRSVTTRTPKVTIPSPTMLHFRGGRGAISRDAYPGPRRVLRRRRAGLSRRDRRPGRRRLHVPAARRHEPRLSLRREDARRRAAARRRSRRVAAALRTAHQRARSRSGRRT